MFYGWTSSADFKWKWNAPNGNISSNDSYSQFHEVLNEAIRSSITDPPP